MAKHPVPKKKTSKARGSRRYKSFRNKARIRLAEAIQLVNCEKCGAAKRVHHACAECGDYRGNKVLGSDTVKESAPVTTIKAD